MASLAEINVRIGARIDQLQKNLRTAERSLRQSGERMKQLGDSLTVGITAPLTALGGFALKAQADFDALRKGIEAAMTNAGGSIEDARTEIELLRKESLKPGLTFDNLLKGSIKLQAVGFSAEEARRSLTVFGNALALAGGNANDLDGVNLALTQIVSKGQVFAEEINQIAERVPQVRKAMLSAFGTARTEEIQKLNLAAEDFVRIITDELAKLPDAPDSLANSFKNARQAITFALQDIGGALEENLNVSGFVQELAQKIINISKAFANLNPVAQKFIIISAGILAAIGPILSTTGRLIKFTGQLQTAYLATSVSINKLKFRVLESVKAFQALSVAQKATIIGLAVAAILAAAAAYQSLSGGLTTAGRAQTKLNQAQTEAIANTESELTKTRALIGIIDDENASREAKVRAINELKKISPEYFGQLDIEDGKVKGLTQSYEDYSKALLQAARNKVLQQQIEDLTRQAVELEQALQGDFFDETSVLGFTGVLEAAAAPGGAAGALARRLADVNGQIQTLTGELQTGLQKEFEEAKVSSDETGESFATTFGKGASDVLTFEQELQKLQETLATLPKRSEEYYDTLKKIADLQERIAFIDRPAENVPQQVQTGTGIVQPVTFESSKSSEDDLTKSINDKWKNIQKNIDTPKLSTEPFSQYRDAIAQINENTDLFADKNEELQARINATKAALLGALEEGWVPTSEAVKFLKDEMSALEQEQQKVNNNVELVIDGIQTFANTFVSSVRAGQGALKALANAAVTAAKKIISTLLARAVAKFIEKSIEQYGIAGLGIGAAGGALVGAIFEAAVPAFANGGVVDSPTLALVGEYPGAKSNPEIIAPEDKLTKIFRENQSDGMGRVAVEDIVIEGDKLRIVLDEANRRYSRYGG